MDDETKDPGRVDAEEYLAANEEYQEDAPVHTPEEYAAGVQAKIDSLEQLVESAQTVIKMQRADIATARERIAEWKRLLPRKRRGQRPQRDPARDLPPKTTN